MKKWNIRGNVLRKWLLSYLLVLLAPLVGTALTYTYTHQTLAREVAAANRQTLSGVMTGVDDAFRQMVYTAESLATNTYFKNAMNDGRVEEFDGLSLVRWNSAGQIARLQEFGCNLDRYDPYAHGPEPQFRDERAAWF